MRSLLTSLRATLHGPLGRTLTRFALGSALAMVVSEVTLMSVFGLHLGSARVAAAAGWGAGFISNYSLTRTWAWGRKGRSDLARELLPYWITSIACLLLSMWATHTASALAPKLSGDHTLATVLVGAAYLATYGVLFVVKFVLFHFVIFADRRSSAAGVPGSGM